MITVVFNVDQQNLPVGDTFSVEDIMLPGGIWKTLFVNAGGVIINIHTITTIIINGLSKGTHPIIFTKVQ